MTQHIVNDMYHGDRASSCRTIDTIDFIKTFGTNIYSRNAQINSKKDVAEIFQMIWSRFDHSGATYRFYTPNNFTVASDRLLIMVDVSNANNRDLHLDEVAVAGVIKPTDVLRLNIEMFGSMDDTSEFLEWIKSAMLTDRGSTVTWAYMSGPHIQQKVIYLENQNECKDQFYPWFRGGVDRFIDSYLADPAAILILYGPPGTGKTSFLRYLLTKNKLRAIVSYDEKVLSDDYFFVEFMTGNENDIMVIEDADAMLASRETDHNKLMSKFLNVSDGLIKLPNKKMIFTTNITNLTKVDPALMRKGRCFSTVEFRELTSDEAHAAAAAAGFEGLDWYSKPAWPLTEVFNHADSLVELKATPMRKIGF